MINYLVKKSKVTSLQLNFATNHLRQTKEELTIFYSDSTHVYL